MGHVGDINLSNVWLFLPVKSVPYLSREWFVNIVIILLYFMLLSNYLRKYCLNVKKILQLSIKEIISIQYSSILYKSVIILLFIIIILVWCAMRILNASMNLFLINKHIQGDILSIKVELLSLLRIFNFDQI